MKQSLQIRLGQQLTMTPQLQQAIKLLQLSTLDLQQEIQQALESNMMLEVEEDHPLDINESQLEKKTEKYDEITAEGSQTDIPDELPTDSNWEDVFDNTQASNSSSSENVEFESQR
ncbi:MAG: RNA polymerase factor sigma-54, partial [Methylicorpusculum sp.]|nr:RNA polymerase factor sigma-54 [Methylicorpusculum sp.]